MACSGASFFAWASAGKPLQRAVAIEDPAVRPGDLQRVVHPVGGEPDQVRLCRAIGKAQKTRRKAQYEDHAGTRQQRKEPQHDRLDGAAAFHGQCREAGGDDEADSERADGCTPRAQSPEDARDGVMAVERVQQALSVPFSIGGYDHVSSASIGMALSSGTNAQPEYLLRSADIAMYRAKNSGRGRYEIFDRTMHAEALTRLQIESDLRHAFERDEFFLEYQPIVRLSDGCISGVEALVRWRHPTRGLLTPDKFLGIAEELDVVQALDRLTCGDTTIAGVWLGGSRIIETAEARRARRSEERI